MAKSVGMFQRPVEYKARKPYGWSLIEVTTTEREDSPIRIESFNDNSNKIIEFYVVTLTNLGYEYNSVFAFKIFSELVDLDKRFYNAVKALELLKKSILEDNYVFNNSPFIDDYYRQAFKSLYPAVIDQVIASVKANEEVIKNSDRWEFSLL